MKITRLIASSTVAILLATSSIAQEEPNSDTVIATVNGKDVTVGHVIALADRLPERFKQLPDADLYKGVVEQLIQQTALASGLDANTKAVKIALENEARALLANITLTNVEDAAVTEEAIEKAYAEKYSDVAAEKEWRASHILVETEVEAKELVTALKGGADFAELAKEKSTGPSGPGGGDLGWMGKGRLVPEFENAMIALEAGGVSAPVQTQFGWHVIKLMESRDLPPPTLAEVREELIDQIKGDAATIYLEKLELTADIQRSEVEIDPTIIRKIELLED